MKKFTRLLFLIFTLNGLLLSGQLHAKVNSQVHSQEHTKATLSENKKNLTDDENSFKTALALINSADKMANTQDREKMLSNARSELTNAVSKNRSYVEAIYFRGVINLMLGNLDEGEADLLRAIEINPKTAEAHYNLACLYSVKGNMELGLMSLDNALKNGFKDINYLLQDPDLALLRSAKEFDEVLAKNKSF